jgi:hypothetical protein
MFRKTVKDWAGVEGYLRDRVLGLAYTRLWVQPSV